jgi:hypothetical protein
VEIQDASNMKTNRLKEEELVDEVRTGSIGDDDDETRLIVGGETEFRDNLCK